MMKYNQRIRYVEPDQLQSGYKCRLGGVEFLSIAQACRYWGISYTTAREHVHNGNYQDEPRKNWKHPLNYEAAISRLDTHTKGEY